MDKKQMEEALQQGKAFQLKNDTPPDTVEITFDELVELCLLAQQRKAEEDKKFKQFKTEIKNVLEGKGLTTYETPTGTRVTLTTQQRTNYNKELLMELLGDDYTRCAKVSTTARFLIKKA
jgi:hypothetical protein